MQLTVSPQVHGGAVASVKQLRLEEGLAAGAGFQVGAELCDGRHLADPYELTLQGASNLDFRSRADATDGEITIRGGADAHVDQLRLKEGLAVDADNQIAADLHEQAL